MSRLAAAPGRASVALARATVRQRLVARAVSAVSWLACHLPERPQLELADLCGELWYRLDANRAAQARRNLERVARWLVEADLADARVTAAARDPQALDRLVRAAFRHYARYYLDVARAPALTPGYLAERLTVETPDQFEAAFAGARAADLHRSPSRGDRAAGLRRGGPRGAAVDDADGDDRRPGAAGLFRTDSGCARHPHRGPARGSPGADGGARARRAGRARRRS